MPQLPPHLPHGDAVLPVTLPGPLPLKLRRSLAALSLVGAALVALPVVQLLRYQAAEEKNLVAARTRLDPMSRAVHLQRGLLAHRDMAAQVLTGHPKLEPERLQRQNEVDGRVAALMAALAGGQWDVAVDEAEALQQDWRQLIAQLLQKRIDVAGNAAAHRLLVEQTLQIIDLVTAAAPADARTGTTDPVALVPTATLVAMQTLPRLIWQTSLLDDAAEPAAVRLDEVETQLARTLGRLEGAENWHPPGWRHAPESTPAPPAPADATGSETRAPDTALLQAVAGAGASSERYFGLLRGAADPAERQAARQAALQAQMRLFDLAQGRAATLLASRGRAVSQRRALLFGGMTMLALLALGLVGRLWRGLLQWQGETQAAEGIRPMATVADQPPGDAAARQAQSDGLMDRLRSAERPAPSAPSAAAPVGPVAPAAAAPTLRAEPDR